jgi:DNA-binding PadR family transcriptional regulator
VRRVRDVRLLGLTALASGAMPGQRIQVEIESLSGRPVGPGTLYGALGKLEAEGSVRPVGNPGRGVPYELTAEGRSRLAEQIARTERIVQMARARMGGVSWTV